MGKKGKTTQTQRQTSNQTQSTSFDPAAVSAAWDNYNRTTAATDQLSRPYAGPLVAGFNDTQRDAQQRMLGIANRPSNGFNEVAQMARELGSFAPPQVQGKGYQAVNATAAQIARNSVRDVTAGQLKNIDLNPYLNLFTKDVIDTFGQDYERQRKIALVGDRQRAQGLGAFNGSRHGVAEMLTNEASMRAFGGLAAQLRQAGFENAQQAAIGDLNRVLAADQSNQGMDFNVGSHNTGLATQVALANAASQNRANEFSADQALNASQYNASNAIAGAGVRSNAAGLLANATQSDLQQQLTLANLVSAVGDSQQAQDQAAIDAALQQAIQQNQNTIAAQQLNLAALQGIPMATTVNSSGSSNGSTVNQDHGAALSDALKLAALFVPSDLRLKQDIEEVGLDSSGRRWIDYRYIWDEPDVRRRGVIAQEIAQTDPEAVRMHPSGFLMVDYSKLEDGR